MIILQDIAKRIISMEQFIEQQQVHEQQNSNSGPSNESLSEEKSRAKNGSSNRLPEETKSRSEGQADLINQNMIIKNSNPDYSVKDKQSQVSGYKEKVSSINRILSDEIKRLVKENKDCMQDSIQNDPASQSKFESQIENIDQIEHISQIKNDSRIENASQSKEANQVEQVDEKIKHDEQWSSFRYE